MNRETTYPRKDPFEVLRATGWPLGRLFDDVFGRTTAPAEETDQLHVPAVDVLEDEHGLTIAVELPGILKEDVKITIENGVLSVSGRKKPAADIQGKTWHRNERRYGTFYRSITLPTGVSGEKAQASFAEGVLTVVLPKREDVKPRSIEIR